MKYNKTNNLLSSFGPFFSEIIFFSEGSSGFLETKIFHWSTTFPRAKTCSTECLRTKAIILINFYPTPLNIAYKCSGLGSLLVTVVNISNGMRCIKKKLDLDMLTEKIPDTNSHEFSLTVLSKNISTVHY